MTGRKLNDTLGKLHFWLLTPSFLAMTFGQMRVGLLGFRRRIADYDPNMGFTDPQLIITIAGFLIGLSVLLFMVNLWVSARSGEVAVGNIWNSRSPEWQTPSPAPMHNYPEPMRVVGNPYDYGLPNSKYVEFGPHQAGD
jgi:cytochrome c oxidase subunit 1